MDRERQNAISEGVLAGLISGSVIVVWLLVVDMIAGHPLFTPNILGRGLVSILGMRMADTTMLHIAVYTVFHYVAFAAVGIIVAMIVRAARRTPAVLAGFLILFIAFEFGFYGLAAMLSVNSDLQSLAWYQIMAANLVAAFVMLYFMWVRHPELKGEISDALGGTDA